MRIYEGSFLGRLFAIEPYYTNAKISLRLMSTWLLLTNVIKPRIGRNPGYGYLKPRYSCPCDVRVKCKEGYL